MGEEQFQSRTTQQIQQQCPEFEPFPTRLGFRYRESRTPDRSILKLSKEPRGTSAVRFERRGGYCRGYDALIRCHEKVTVLSNRPSFVDRIPIDCLMIDEDPALALHWFEPRIAGLAEQCRFAANTDAQTTVTLEEGDFGFADDYPRLRFS